MLCWGVAAGGMCMLCWGVAAGGMACAFCAGEWRNMHVVCRTGFAKAYNVSVWYIDDLVIRLKKRKWIVVMFVCLHACLCCVCIGS